MLELFDQLTDLDYTILRSQGHLTFPTEKWIHASKTFFKDCIMNISHLGLNFNKLYIWPNSTKQTLLGYALETWILKDTILNLADPLDINFNIVCQANINNAEPDTYPRAFIRDLYHDSSTEHKEYIKRLLQLANADSRNEIIADSRDLISCVLNYREHHFDTT